MSEQSRLVLVFLLTKITALRNNVALTYHRVRGLYFLVVFFAANISLSTNNSQITIVHRHSVGDNSPHNFNYPFLRQILNLTFTWYILIRLAHDFMIKNIFNKKYTGILNYIGYRINLNLLQVHEIALIKLQIYS